MEPSATPAAAPLPAGAPAPLRLISRSQFIWFCLLSWGLYGLWWQFKAWRFFKQQDQSDSWPAARALFSLFTVHELGQRVEKLARQQGQTVAFSPGNLAGGYVVVSLLAWLPDPYFVVSVFSFAFLLPLFSAFNEALLASDSYAAAVRPGLSGRHLALVVLGGLLWVLLLYSLTLPA